jgi:hypothetical protein
MARKALRVRLRRAAVAEIRTSPEMDGALQEIVDDILAEVGGEASGTATNVDSATMTATQRNTYDDYDGGVNPGRRRSRGFVVTTSWKSIRDEARDHVLLRALAAQAGKRGGA